MADVDDSQVYSAVMAMKEAVQIAIQLGDIQNTAVCKGTGMSTSQLHQWLNSRSQSAEWDTRVAEWLKRTQGQAAARAASTKSDGGSAAPKKKADKPAAAAASSSSAAAGGGDPEVKKLNKLREDVRELEDYIPWNAVVPSWGGKRSAWARKLKESPDVQAVGQHLTALEAALVDHAMAPGWRGAAARVGGGHRVGDERAEDAWAAAGDGGEYSLGGLQAACRHAHAAQEAPRLPFRRAVKGECGRDDRL